MGAELDQAIEDIENAERLRNFKPQVGRPKPRMRMGFVVALIVTMAFTVVALLYRLSLRSEHGSDGQALVNVEGCTALQVEQTLRDHDMSPTDRATCLAVAGKLERARGLLNAMGSRERNEAIFAIFNVAHPIADSGDDESAGPIMDLVVEFWPDNYMAVFHSGMAKFALGRDEEAKPRLEQFLEMYQPRDVWHDRAAKALHDIDANTALDKREAHFTE